jgi:hypothetical protein
VFVLWGSYITEEKSMDRLPVRFVLYRDLDGTAYEVDLPLTSHVDPCELRKDLGLPSYIDLNYYPMRSAMVTIWAAVNAPRLHELYP